MREQQFAEYFGNCPVVYVSGRTFPVCEKYLSDVHRIVAAGQALQAAQGGKVVKNDPMGVAGGKKKKGTIKGGNKEQKLSIAPPKFDHELIAELVLRIITTSKSAENNKGRQGKVQESRGEAILVFLSGIQAIDKVNRALRQRSLAQLHNVQVQF